MIKEIIDILELLPLDLSYKIETGTLAPCGYGAHRQYVIHIVAVYEECAKCGYNTFNPDEALNDNHHRHSWILKEKVLEVIFIRTKDDEEKAKQIISKYI